MNLAEFEPAIPETNRLQTHALDRAATGIGFAQFCHIKPGEGDHYTVLCCETRHLPLWLILLYNTYVTNYTGWRESYLILQVTFAPPCIKILIFLRCTLITR